MMGHDVSMSEYVPNAGTMTNRHAGEVVMVHLDDATGPRYWQAATVRSGTAATGYTVRMDTSGTVFDVANGRVRGLSASEAERIASEWVKRHP